MRAVQVLTLGQTAEVLLQCNPEAAFIEQLLGCIAQQHAFPSKQEVLAQPHDKLGAADWDRFWRYTEHINPYVSMHACYVPVAET